MLMQIIYHKSTYVTPNAGRPQAFRRAGAGEEKRHENPISQIARFGGDIKSRFPEILKKNTGVGGGGRVGRSNGLLLGLFTGGHMLGGRIGHA